MTHKLILLFNHKVTELQAKDAYESLGVDRIEPLPPDLQNIWSNIPPEMSSIKDYLRPVEKWLSENAVSGDYVLIQGDFGACYLMVNLALSQNLAPVYSTTARIAQESILDGGHISLTHTFKHVMFRKYGE